MYLILPVPVVLRLMAFTLQLSEIMAHMLTLSAFRLECKAYEVESNTAYTILKLGLQFTGFPTNAYKSDLSS